MAHLSRDASKDERIADHKARMAERAERRERLYRIRKENPAPKPLANLSIRHPDHGMTPAEHAARKAKRRL